MTRACFHQPWHGCVLDFGQAAAPIVQLHTPCASLSASLISMHSVLQRGRALPAPCPPPTPTPPASTPPRLPHPIPPHHAHHHRHRHPGGCPTLPPPTINPSSCMSAARSTPSALLPSRPTWLRWRGGTSATTCTFGRASTITGGSTGGVHCGWTHVPRLKGKGGLGRGKNMREGRPPRGGEGRGGQQGLLHGAATWPSSVAAPLPARGPHTLTQRGWTKPTCHASPRPPPPVLPLLQRHDVGRVLQHGPHAQLPSWWVLGWLAMIRHAPPLPSGCLAVGH